MHQPMQGAQAQVQKSNTSFYDQGWNDYIYGIKPDFKDEWAYTLDYKDGWFDCREATKKYGQQEEI